MPSYFNIWSVAFSVFFLHEKTDKQTHNDTQTPLKTIPASLSIVRRTRNYLISKTQRCTLRSSPTKRSPRRKWEPLSTSAGCWSAVPLAARWSSWLRSAGSTPEMTSTDNWSTTVGSQDAFDHCWTPANRSVSSYGVSRMYSTHHHHHHPRISSRLHAWMPPATAATWLPAAAHSKSLPRQRGRRDRRWSCATSVEHAAKKRHASFKRNLKAYYNIQASPKDIPVQLSTLLPLTIECAIGLNVEGALQMLLLLLLLLLLLHAGC